MGKGIESSRLLPMALHGVCKNKESMQECQRLLLKKVFFYYFPKMGFFFDIKSKHKESMKSKLEKKQFHKMEYAEVF